MAEARLSVRGFGRFSMEKVLVVCPQIHIQRADVVTVMGGMTGMFGVLATMRQVTTAGRILFTGAAGTVGVNTNAVIDSNPGPHTSFSGQSLCRADYEKVN
jgi:hypothetical protein